MGAVGDFLIKHREGILYLIFGALTVLVRWSTYAFFVLLGIELNISNILSWICGVMFAFVVNKWFVFLSKSLERSVVAKEMVSFFSLRIVIGLIAIALFPILLAIGLDQSILGVAGAIAVGITTLMEIVLNYLASKFIVFRKKKENAS